MLKKILLLLLLYVGIPFVGCLPCFLLSLFIPQAVWLGLVIVPGITVLLCCRLRKKVDMNIASRAYAVILIMLSLCFTVLMIVNRGNVWGVLINSFISALFPFAQGFLVATLMGVTLFSILVTFVTYAAALITCTILSDEWRGRVLMIPGILFLACLAVCIYQYNRRPEVRYAGHGFLYMNGYSSTDFSDYMVYSDASKLVTLGHEPELVIEDEADMPVMDGAEACYPLYAALAKEVYRDIDKIESLAALTDTGQLNGKIVTFTNTVNGFYRLLDGDVDLFFGAKPSQAQLSAAETRNVPLEITVIGREGFVFFVEEDNPVEDLTSEQIKAIYHGDITNWKEVGGKDQKILAFQRPQNSGSQTMMEYFMGDIGLKPPETYEMVDAMAGVIHKVAEYANDDGAMGYSFRYFLEGLNQEKGVRLLSVDGVAPTLENIENGSYPLTVSLCLVTRKDDPNPYVQKMIDFILSEDGQEIVRKTGYAGVSE